MFEDREEAEAEANRLSARMNSDPGRKAKFAYEARELPPALLYRRAAWCTGNLHHHGLRAVHLDRARERRLAGTLEGFVAFSSPIVEGMRKRRSPLAFSASAMRAFINPAVEAGICRHPPARGLKKSPAGSQRLVADGS
jgi:hypothetical protein